MPEHMLLLFRGPRSGWSLVRVFGQLVVNRIFLPAVDLAELEYLRGREVSAGKMVKNGCNSQPHVHTRICLQGLRTGMNLYRLAMELSWDPVSATVFWYSTSNCFQNSKKQRSWT